MSNDIVQYGMNDMKVMADAFVRSGLFGIKKPEEAMALMLVAQAEGLHPATAARDYHIISGRPTLKADAMMSRFQQAGGSVRWIKLTDEIALAEFSHPQGGSVEISWDMARAKKAQLGGNGMWAKYPRQMLRSRCLSEGIRTVFPGVVVGTYTPEEVEDFEEKKSAAPQNFSGRTIENESPVLPQAMPRDEQEKIYDEILADINGAADIDTLAKAWAPHTKTVAKLDEDFRIDLVQKKDEAKEELLKAASGLDAKLERAEALVSE